MNRNFNNCKLFKQLFSFVSSNNRLYSSSVMSSSAQSSSSYPNRIFQRTTSSYQLTSENSLSRNQNRFLSRFFPNRSPLYAKSESSRTPAQPFGRTTFYEPNYTLTSGNTSTERSALIMCVTEGNGVSKGTIGLAAIHLHTSELELSQFTDNSNYESLRNNCIHLQPSVIILPKTFVKEDNHLYEILSNEMDGIFLKDMDRRCFNDTEGLELIKKLQCDDWSSIEIQLKSKYYCLASCAALLKYLEIVENLIYAPKALRVVFKSAVNTMFIDPTTAKLLELIVNLNDPKSAHTLFGTINKTKTKPGYRLLRSNLLQPSTDIKLIESRLDMIDAIVSSQSFFDRLGEVLDKFSGIEIERVISCLVHIPKRPDPNVKIAERKIECILILKHIISLIDPLIETLSICETNVFAEYLQVLNDQRFAVIMSAIDEYITEECKYTKGGLKMKLEKCSAIKRDINSLLDIARDAYSESIDDAYHLIYGFCEKYKTSLPIRETYTPSRGYHMEIVCKNDDRSQFRFPKEFMKIVFNKKTINFTTQELINKNNRINSAVEEIYIMSDSVISILIENIRQFIGCLYNLSEVISKIDLVYSLGSQCALANYVRPQFSDYVAIRMGTHPVLEKVLNQKPVANDIFLSEDSNFIILTGPNMSGKSTLLKQVAIHQVLAQIGSYVPAESATFKIFDKLFSRIGNNDEIETNSSTFMVEMREMSYILNNLSDSSLVIIDELGRGTSVEEGVGICFAICEHLLQTKAFTLMATHFVELTKLENFYLNVSNFNFVVKHEENEGHDDSYVFTHIMEPGATKELFYGLRLANYTAMDPSILSRAQEFAQILSDRQRPAKINERLNQTQRVNYELASLLKAFMRKGGLPDVETLEAVQTHYRQQIESSESSYQTDQEMSELQNDFALI